MFHALFNSLSGLFSFSKSLDTVSNNVANMNTPGFRGSDSFFENVNGGRGTRIGGEGVRANAGDIRQTGTSTDLAIDGSGYFILRDEQGRFYYTRAGQFRFDEGGRLIDTATGYEVMAIDAQGNLQAIDLDDYRTLQPQATGAVRMSGNIVPGTATTNVGSIQIYDTTGGVHTLTATLTDNGTVTAGSYLVSVVDETGATVGSGEVRFGTDGTPVAAFNALTLNLSYGGVAQAVTLNFGTPGAFDGATRLTGIAASLKAQAPDGHPLLGVTSLSFDDEGVMQLVYSSSEKRQGPQVALASFPSDSTLDMVGGRLVAGTSVVGREIGRPGAGGLGRIAGSSLEMSNVDLNQEFADMIIIQRGYQASSRVMTVSNEMIEQLYNSSRGG